MSIDWKAEYEAEHERRLAYKASISALAAENERRNQTMLAYEARIRALEAAKAWEEKHLWAFLRSVLLQGQDIALDYRDKGYELMAARIDEAAREREGELNAHRMPQTETGAEHG